MANLLDSYADEQAKADAITGGINADVKASNQYLTNLKNDTIADNKHEGLRMMKAIGYAPVLLPLGAADTVLQSLSFGRVGDQAVSDSLGKFSEDMKATYERGKPVYRGIGDAATMIYGGGLATKAIRAGSGLIRGLEAMGPAGRTAAKVLAIDETAVTRGYQAYKAAAETAGTAGFRGLTGLSQRRAVQLATFKNSLREGASYEAFTGAFQNQSDLFYPEGSTWKDTGAWMAFGLGAGSAINYLQAAKRLRVTGQVAGAMASKVEGLPTGTPGVDITTASYNAARVDTGFGLAADADETVRGAFTKQRTEALLEIKNALAGPLTAAKPGGQALHAKPLDSVSTGTRDFWRDMGVSQTRLTNSLLSVDGPEAAVNFWRNGEKLAAAKKQEIIKTKELATEAGKESGEKAAHYGRVLETQQDELANLEGGMVGFKVNRAGTISSEPALPAIGDDLYSVSAGKTQPNADRFYSVTPGKQAFGKGPGAKDTLGVSMAGRLERNARTITSTDSLGVTLSSRFYAAMPAAATALKAMLALPAADVLKLSKSQALPKPHVIGLDAPFQQLDYLAHATEVAGKGELGALSRFIDARGFASVDEVQWASVQKKYTSYVDRLKTEAAEGAKGYKLTGADYQNWLGLKFTDDWGRSAPVAELFHDLHTQGVRALEVAVGGKSTRGAGKAAGLTSLDDFNKIIRDHVALGASPDTAKALYSGEGVGLAESTRFWDAGLAKKFGEGEASQIQPHSFFVKFKEDGLREERHWDAARVSADQMDKHMNEIADSSFSPVLKEMNNAANSVPELMQRVRNASSELSENSMTQPVIKKLGQISPTTKDFNARDVLGMPEASRMQDIVARAVEKSLLPIFKDDFGKLHSLLGADALPSAQMIGNYYASMNRGWRLLRDAPDEMGRFVLDPNSRVNREIAGAKPVPEFLPDPVWGDGARALMLDGKALEGWHALKKFSAIKYAGDRDLQRALGRTSVGYQNGHLPLPSRYGQDMAFVVNQHGEVVDFALGANLDIAKREAAKKVAARDNPGLYGVVDRSAPENYAAAMDRAWSNKNLDISDAWQTQNRQAKGSRQGTIGDPQEFLREVLSSVQDGFKQQQRRFMLTKFRSTVAAVDHMDRISGEKFSGLLGQRSKQNVFEEYIRTLTGSDVINKGSLYGAMNSLAEFGSDTVIAKLADMTGLLNTRTVSKAEANAISQKIGAQLGLDPVGYAAKLLEQQTGAALPLKTRQILQPLGLATQALSLRLFETAQALLTTLSSVTTIPHIAQFYRRMPGEASEAWAKRVHWAGDVVDAERAIAIPNPYKLAVAAQHMLSSGGMNDLLEKAGKHGYLDAQVGEFVKNAFAPPRFGKAGELGNKFVSLMSRFADKAEDFHRVQSFSAGAVMAKHLGPGMSDEMIMATANDFANRAIADYRPQNRSELFKGAWGAPLAMFQSFAINHFQRMAVSLENKNHRALFTQLGTQQFMFGAQSLPGWELFNDTLMSNYDASQKPSDLLQQGLSSNAYDLLMYGSVANLPKLLGAGDGVSIYTRGDMSLPRNITPGQILQSPSLSMVGRSSAAMLEGLKALASGGVGSVDAFQEAATHAMPNRPLKGLLEIAAGEATNGAGDTTNENTREALSVVTRLMGMKPMQDMRESQVLYEGKLMDAARKQETAMLGRRVAAAIRDGGLTDAVVGGALEEYVARGGSASSARAWLKRVAIKATETKFDQRVIKLLRKGDRSSSAMRFFALDDALSEEAAVAEEAAAVASDAALGQ